ncbi:MAG: hypothetical protein JF597_40980 [Streptomyces sp.]|jgi:hypothetical protein|uniref:hypothetical protein n=1 Tax=Streptomyces sp. TaxID=1931 RepID=UPI0025D1D955|nr:hypothetical protein [Streptomyces sp.]MBW8799728.1 hypothetical protein [Streptomyces sp.]
MAPVELPIGPRCGRGCRSAAEPRRPPDDGPAVHHPLFRPPDALRTRARTGMTRPATTPVLVDATPGVTGPHWNHRKATA